MIIRNVSSMAAVISIGLGSVAAYAADAKTDLSDAQIIQILENSNAGEIAEAQYAVSETGTKSVVDFANMMISNHQDVDAKVRALATKLNLTPATSMASTKQTADAQVEMTKLKATSKKDFDIAYVNAQVAGHQAVLDTIDTKLIPSSHNADLKSLLKDTRPKVATHLDHAKKLQQELNHTAQK